MTINPTDAGVTHLRGDVRHLRQGNVGAFEPHVGDVKIDPGQVGKHVMATKQWASSVRTDVAPHGSLVGKAYRADQVKWLELGGKPGLVPHIAGENGALLVADAKEILHPSWTERMGFGAKSAVSAVRHEGPAAAGQVLKSTAKLGFLGAVVGLGAIAGTGLALNLATRDSGVSSGR